MNDSFGDFSETIGHIYDAAREPDRWREALDSLRRAFAADHGVVIIAPDSAHREGLTLVLGNEFHIDRHFTEHFPVRAPFATIAPRTVASITDLMSWEEWTQSRFYQQVAVDKGLGDILSIEIHLDDRSIYRLRFTRMIERPLFEDAERRLANLLVPHLRRAFEIGRQGAYDKMIHDAYADACNRLGLAAFVVDRRGALLERNGAADALVDDDQGLAVRAGRLVASDDRENRAFQRLLTKVLEPASAADESPQVVSVAREGRMSLGIVVRRVVDPDALRAGVNRPAAIIFVRDPEGQMSDVRTAQRLFDLTPAEAALLIRLANGHSLAEAAADMNVRPSTVRTHLRAIFAKTGTTRQSALVRQVLNSITALGERVH